MQLSSWSVSILSCKYLLNGTINIAITEPVCKCDLFSSVISEWQKSFNLITQGYLTHNNVQCLQFIVRSHELPWSIAGQSQYKDKVFRYKDSHYKDKTVMRPSYLYDRNSYSWKNGMFVLQSVHDPSWSHCSILTWWHHRMETFFTLLVLCRGIHRSSVNSLYKGQWHWALMFSLICAWTKCWVNNRDTGDMRCHHAHYAVTVMSFTRDTQNSYFISHLWGWDI